MLTWIRRMAVESRGRAVVAVGWSEARREYLSRHPFCEVCGYVPDGRLSVANDVHHVIPRHVDPSRVTDQANLITLCRKYGCHLRCGHFGNYREYWNPDIRRIFPNVGAVMADAEKSFKKSLPPRRGLFARAWSRAFGVR